MISGIRVLLGALLLKPVFGAVVSYDWTATWVNANPDGRLVRPVIGINHKWPPPAINVTVGDQIVVKLTNSLGNQTVGLHWHGLHQNGTNAQDGPSGVTQCSLQPGQSYTYNFTADLPGTYWYHSHENGQYPDGLRRPLIIEDPHPPFHYDQDTILTVSDWYHDLMPTLLEDYLLVSKNVNGGSEPIPYSAPINDGYNSKLNIVPGKTYYFQIINMAAFSQIFLEFDQHNMTIVQIDGGYVQPRQVSQLYVANGQRYGVLVTAKTTSTCNFAILASLNIHHFDKGALDAAHYLNPNATATLVYDASASIPSTPVVHKWSVLDDLAFVPQDLQPLLPRPDTTIYINLNFSTQHDRKGASQYRSGFNGTTYIPQKVPTLYTVLSAGKQAANPVIYGRNSNTVVLPHLQVIDIVINNYDSGIHPVHIHGHQPQIIEKQANVFKPSSVPPGARVYPDSTGVVEFNSTDGNPAYPPRRDTWTLAEYGIPRIRFRADNPGVWFLHCHMEWHMSAGLLATIVEAPLALQQSQPTIPPAMASICAAQGVPTAGNAAGNTQNFTDLSGAPTLPANAPWGANIH